MVKKYAIYFPQFYQIEENSRWWGDGFTDWKLVKAAKPLVDGHYQPRIPLLGYLDQSDPQVIKKQVELAMNYGIHGFNFYHYWFDSKPYLDKPVSHFLNSGIDGFEFFFTWANESWTRQWVGKPNDYLLKQEYYKSDNEIELHYNYLSRFFNDSRYKKIDGKPVFCVYRPELIPNLNEIITKLKQLAISDGLNGIYFIAFRSYDVANASELYSSFDGILNFNPRYCVNSYIKGKKKAFIEPYLRLLPERLQSLLNIIKINFQKKTVYSYDRYIDSLKSNEIFFNGKPIYNSVFPDWDNTARYKSRATYFEGASPENFRKALDVVVDNTKSLPNNMILINAWNEWSESAYLEPDKINVYKYLQVIKSL